MSDVSNPKAIVYLSGQSRKNKMTDIGGGNYLSKNDSSVINIRNGISLDQRGAEAPSKVNKIGWWRMTESTEAEIATIRGEVSTLSAILVRLESSVKDLRTDLTQAVVRLDEADRDHTHRLTILRPAVESLEGTIGELKTGMGSLSSVLAKLVQGQAMSRAKAAGFFLGLTLAGGSFGAAITKLFSA
jgi:predicted RNase H-like nuclease (RuvC/YqgF family)